jgi:uncharacterized oligopeptide transporter (OPT) family protein
MSPHDPTPGAPPRSRFLPPIGSTAYYVLLGAVAIFILGPLGGVTASYMNFALGTFVGGQVLAGILGSVVTYGYGPEGKHGANYMQTMAASVAGMSGMAVLIQARTWLGLPDLPAWQMMLFFGSIGMFGVGVGMLYTPILVDRMQLMYPSGLAVANILRALTDKNLLKRSIAKLGGGTLVGVAGGIASLKVPFVEATGLSTALVGTGMIITARIAIPALVFGLVGLGLEDTMREIGWIGPKDEFRKVGFLIALGTILGAAAVDLTVIFYQAITRMRATGHAAEEKPDWKRTNLLRLVLWIGFWGAAVFVIATQMLGLPWLFVLLAILLVFLFLLVNGISQGISDSNPISAAFVMSVFLLAAIGLKDEGIGIMCGSILLIACSVGVDMQQDRSTGWRLGTNRVIQFRYQVIGITMGALLSVGFAYIFMEAFKELRIDQYSHPELKPAHWESAMTYKFVGAIKDITSPKAHTYTALFIGIALGFVMELLRKILKSRAAYKRFIASGKLGFATNFVLDAVVLPSPYASSFGGFFGWLTSFWMTVGGVLSSLMRMASDVKLRWREVEVFTLTAFTASGIYYLISVLGKRHFSVGVLLVVVLVGAVLWTWLASHAKRKAAQAGDELPEDMSTTSLVGGGFIAGDSLAALGVGIVSLIANLL